MRLLSNVVIGFIVSIGATLGTAEFSINDLNRRPAEQRMKEIAERPWENTRFYAYSWKCMHGGSSDPYAMCKAYPRAHVSCYTECVLGTLLDVSSSREDLETLFNIPMYTRNTTRTDPNSGCTIPSQCIESVAAALEEYIVTEFQKSFQTAMEHGLFAHSYKLALAYKVKDENESNKWIESVVRVTEEKITRLAREAKYLNNDLNLQKALEVISGFPESEQTKLKKVIERAYQSEVATSANDIASIKSQYLEKGMADGEKAKALEIAALMLNRNMDLELIRTLTGLSEEEIGQLNGG